MGLSRHDTDLLASQGRFRIGNVRSLLGLLCSPMEARGQWGNFSHISLGQLLSQSASSCGGSGQARTGQTTRNRDLAKHTEQFEPCLACSGNIKKLRMMRS